MLFCCFVGLQYPLVVLMLTVGEIYQLINFTSFSRWFFMALATLGLIIHRYRFPLLPRPFKVSESVVIVLACASFPISVVHWQHCFGCSYLYPEGAPGHSLHLHSGLLLHRGSVSVLGPLEHRVQLCSHSHRSPVLLCGCSSLSLAP